MTRIQNAYMYYKECGGKIIHEVFIPGRESMFLSKDEWYCEDCGKEYDFKDKAIGYIEK